MECDRGKEWCNSTFRNFLKAKSIHQYSRYTKKGPSKAERVIRTVRNLLKNPVLKKGNIDWFSELPSVIKKYNNSLHNSIKMTPIEGRKKPKKK